ncbi:MAG: hypothetical protein Q7R84_03370 [bacterium]|nr:hypothetical protein [bacterium]
MKKGLLPDTRYFLLQRKISECSREGFMALSWKHSVEEKKRLEILGNTGSQIVEKVAHLSGVSEISISPQEFSLKRNVLVGSWEEVIIKLTGILEEIFGETVKIRPQ